MNLRDPIAVYNAASNVEAHLVKLFLVDSRIEAFVSEDLSTGGMWMFGTLPEIHKPQVWVSAGDIDRAKPVLQAYERQAAQRKLAGRQAPTTPGSTIVVLCEECQHSSAFPSEQKGTIQDCPKCGAFVDVGNVDESDPYWLEADGSAE